MSGSSPFITFSSEISVSNLASQAAGRPLRSQTGGAFGYDIQSNITGK